MTLRPLTLVAALLLPVALVSPASAGALAPPAAFDPSAGAATLPRTGVDAGLQRELSAVAGDTRVPVVVRLRDRADLGGLPTGRAARGEAVVRRLQAVSEATQAALLERIGALESAGEVEQVTPLWVVNAVALAATPAAVAELAARPEVAAVVSDEVLTAPADGPQANIEEVTAPAMWDLGARGAGVVIATLDTGVEVEHPDLASRFRGGTNSWFNPYSEFPTPDPEPDFPFDVNGHGTATTGVMVGQSGIGVAPDAMFIAAKIFRNDGSGSDSAVHRAFQWVLDPDGNPDTADAPTIVSNAWSRADPGCDLAFAPDITALRAAGIVPVFAAGNLGPIAGSSVSPANNPGALAVGATDLTGTVYEFSGRGPTACGSGTETYPHVSAPGVDVRSTDLFGGYRVLSGTSLAAPHVSGALAVLASALPGRSPAEREAALVTSARDVGPVGADNDTGSGLLDIKAAYDALVATPPPPPPPPPPPDPALVLFSTARSDAPGSGSTVIAVTTSGLRVLFDGSDVGLGDVDVVGVERAPDGALLLAVDGPVTLPGAGPVTAYDVLRFRPTALGDQTAGSFDVALRGAAVGLATATERIDALALAPDGRLLVSTTGSAIVGSVAAAGEDLIAFSPATAGSSTEGTWALHFDGSTVGLSGRAENVDAALVLRPGVVALSTTGRFTVRGTSGRGEDIFTCRFSDGVGRGCTTIRVSSAVIAAALAGRTIDAVSLP